jgi:C1A family cysteine protease
MSGKNRHLHPGGTKRHIWGWKPDTPDSRDMRFMARVPDPRTGRGIIPPACDLSAHWPTIKDQADLGACTAFSSTAAMKYLYLKEGKHAPDLSELFVYFYTRQAEGTPPNEDSGAMLRDVMKTLAAMGAPKQEAWPYDPKKFASQPPDEAVKQAAAHRVVSYRRCFGITPGDFLAAIKQAIAGGYPVVGGFSVPQNMMNDDCARTGVIKPRAPQEELVGGHAVPFAGYCDLGATHPWIPPGHLAIPNSWSPRWGRAGWCFLPYSYVYEGLVDDCWVIVTEEEFFDV